MKKTILTSVLIFSMVTLGALATTTQANNVQAVTIKSSDPYNKYFYEKKSVTITRDFIEDLIGAKLTPENIYKVQTLFSEKELWTSVGFKYAERELSRNLSDTSSYSWRVVESILSDIASMPEGSDNSRGLIVSVDGNSYGYCPKYKLDLSPKETAAILAEREAEEARIKTEREAEEARIKAEREAEEARIKAEREAEEARIKAEREAEEARIKAEDEAEEARIKAEDEAFQNLHFTEINNIAGVDLNNVTKFEFNVSSPIVTNVTYQVKAKDGSIKAKLKYKKNKITIQKEAGEVKELLTETLKNIDVDQMTDIRVLTTLFEAFTGQKEVIENGSVSIEFKDGSKFSIKR